MKKPNMNPEQYNELDKHFANCVELGLKAREAYIQEHCAGKDGYELELRELLAHDSEISKSGGSPLRPIVESAFTLLKHEAPIPESIDGYRIIRELGRGGMGVVYEAQQSHPNRRVAIKILNGVHTEALVRMMQRETDLLGRIESTGIARVYGAGVAEIHGRSSPYIVMELIDGIRVDDFVLGIHIDVEDADARSGGHRDTPISRQGVIELIAKIADAVQQAHTQGVIHRDLKPANILVRVDEQGAAFPVVLDFGVAKLLNPESNTLTLQQGIVGTLGYLSPEQLSADHKGNDTRSDVYSIGAIGFYLLTGYELYDLGGLSIQAALYKMSQEQSSPQSKMSPNGQTLIKGDTRLVIAKALSSMPEERYQTAAALAEDLRRLNSSEPIHARKPSNLYALQKCVSRNRTVSFIAFTLILVMIGSILVIERQRAIAVQKTESAQEIAGFLQGIISSASPNELGKDVTVREAIAQSEALLGDRFESDPLVEADLRMILGRTHRSLGDEQRSFENYQIAHRIFSEQYGVSDRRTLYALGRVGVALRNVERHDEAIVLFKDLLEVQTRRFGDEDSDTLTTLNSLGILYTRTNRLEDALVIHHRVLDTHRARGKQDVPLYSSMHNLGMLYRKMERYDEALPLLVEAEDGYRAIGQRVPALVTAQARGSVLIAQGRLHAAGDHLLNGLLESEEILPVGHYLIKIFLVRLGEVCILTERLEDARKYLERSLVESEFDTFFSMRPQATEMLKRISSE